jgi:hypothetical protein
MSYNKNDENGNSIKPLNLQVLKADLEKLEKYITHNGDYLDL